jgi:hypothetical protein
MVAGLPEVLVLDRARVRARAVERFGIERMATEYIAVYERVARGGSRPGSHG